MEMKNVLGISAHITKYTHTYTPLSSSLSLSVVPIFNTLLYQYLVPKQIQYDAKKDTIFLMMEAVHLTACHAVSAN